MSLPGAEERSAAPRLLGPLLARYVAVLGFMGCGAIVIATASAIALTIQ